jgi:Protein of unknown function (DUF3891)
MVIRELKDGRSYVSLQEDHAELSAQFAAHWGNDSFSQLRPYKTMVFATTYHDSGYREFEGNPPINAEKGRPYAHRESIPSFEATELKAYAKNVEWLCAHDLYAGLIVSMHRTGLWHNRYNVFTKPAGNVRERSVEVQNAKKELEAKQEEYKKSLAGGNPAFDNELWHNYRALQIFDLLSLYFCCDGYVSEHEFKEYTIFPIRVAYDSNEEVELKITPNGLGSVKITPYPFDTSPLQFSVRARLMTPVKGQSAEAGLEAYQKAPRQLLTFEVSG